MVTACVLCLSLHLWALPDCTVTTLMGLKELFNFLLVKGNDDPEASGMLDLKPRVVSSGRNPAFLIRALTVEFPC